MPQLIKQNVEKYFPAAAGSKYVRSEITLLYLQTLGQEITPEQRDFLTAIELIHNASLLHDDVIDGERSRRGAGTPIITGDYLLAIAMQMVPAHAVPMLAKTLENMCLGEFTQLEYCGREFPPEIYLQKTAQKTAGLFEVAFAGCGLPTEFAYDFGMAFQIRNDVDDREKDEAIGIFNTHATEELLANYFNRLLCYTEYKCRGKCEAPAKELNECRCKELESIIKNFIRG